MDSLEILATSLEPSLQAVAGVDGLSTSIRPEAITFTLTSVPSEHAGIAAQVEGILRSEAPGFQVLRVDE